MTKLIKMILASIISIFVFPYCPNRPDCVGNENNTLMNKQMMWADDLNMRAIEPETMEIYHFYFQFQWFENKNWQLQWRECSYVFKFGQKTTLFHTFFHLLDWNCAEPQNFFNAPRSLYLQEIIMTTTTMMAMTMTTLTRQWWWWQSLFLELFHRFLKIYHKTL